MQFNALYLCSIGIGLNYSVNIYATVYMDERDRSNICVKKQM
jgi:hypothetical protein